MESKKYIEDTMYLKSGNTDTDMEKKMYGYKGGKGR